MLAVEDSTKDEEVEVVVVNTDDEGISEKNEGAVVKKKKRKTKIKAKKLILNVSLTKYHVVRYVGKKYFMSWFINSTVLTRRVQTILR